MKNALTPSEGTAAVSEPWREALRTFDADLQRRGSAERTRKAYGTDAAELAAWATANGLTPDAGRLQGPAPLGRAAEPARRGAADDGAQAGEHPQPVPLAARARRRGRQPRRPAARRRSCRTRCRRRSSRHDIARLLERIPACTPLEQRDRALFELAYSSGLRAEELVDLDVTSINFDQEQVRVEGKGAKTRFVPTGEPALRSIADLSRTRPPGIDRRGARDRAVRVQERQAALDTSDVRRRLRVWARHASTRSGVHTDDPGWSVIRHCHIDRVPSRGRYETVTAIR